jgi:threonine dehydrogenase-like Zn-dependent dehydrogenase
MQTWNWRGLDVINAHERDPRIYVDGMRRAMALAAAGVLDFRRFLTHVMPIEELNRGFELLATRPDGFLKAIVTTGAAA